MKLLFYKTSRGDEPVREYLEGLSEKEEVAMAARLAVLMETGRLDMPHGRKMSGQGGLYEIRSGRHRVLYCIKGGTAVLLHAFPKKSQKTPQKEIEVATKRMKQVEN